MSIRLQSHSSQLSRRRLVQGAAASAAFVGLGGRCLPALAQDATPAAGSCAEPFDAGLLSTVKMVTDGSPITVAIVPKGVHPFFEDCRIGAEEEAKALGVNFE